MKIILILFMCVVLTAAVIGCASSPTPTTTTPAQTTTSAAPTSPAATTTSPAATTISPPATTASPTTAPTASPSGGQTFGQMASAGAGVFASRCSGCHGANGQGVTGPAVVGANANLGKYNTAKGLFDYISVAMPMNAPGSLPRQDYLSVLAFLLTQNNKVPSGNAFIEAQLESINLK